MLQRVHAKSSGLISFHSLSLAIHIITDNLSLFSCVRQDIIFRFYWFSCFSGVHFTDHLQILVAWCVSFWPSLFPLSDNPFFHFSFFLFFDMVLDFHLQEPEAENINYEEVSLTLYIYKIWKSCIFALLLNCFFLSWSILQDYITNSRGLKLFTCSWLPRDREPKALIFLCHGYGMECSITMRSQCHRFFPYIQLICLHHFSHFNLFDQAPRSGWWTWVTPFTGSITRAMGNRMDWWPSSTTSTISWMTARLILPASLVIKPQYFFPLSGRYEINGQIIMHLPDSTLAPAHAIFPFLIYIFVTFCLCSFTERKENKEKMRYLMGESMGGAVALLLHRKRPEFWDGAVLVAPMCKVSVHTRLGLIRFHIRWIWHIAWSHIACFRNLLEYQ